MPRGPADLSVERRTIDSAPGLVDACRAWRRLPVIGVDTEFVRERTFYPGLGLIQVSDGPTSTLIDAVAIADLEPFRGVLRDPGVVKVFHSCGEDLEVLHHRFETFPREVFDTQIAATLTGLGRAPGYAKLVDAMFGVELPKDKTRTNWLKRPLSEAQQSYAALDVAYLVPAYERLRDELRRLGREDWLREELEPLFDRDRFLPDPRDAYLRIGARRSLVPRPLATLRALAAWRERQARRRNLPRNFVLKEKALVAIARRAPATRADLAAIDSLHPKTLERHGATLLRLVRQAGRLDAADLPEPGAAPIDLAPYRRHVRRLRAAVAEVAEAAELPADLLATRKTIESLVRRAVAGESPVWPSVLRGWRRTVVGDRLLTTLDELDTAPS